MTYFAALFENAPNLANIQGYLKIMRLDNIVTIFPNVIGKQYSEKSPELDISYMNVHE